MNSKKDALRFEFIIDDWQKVKKNPLTMIGILVMLPLIYLLVYATGGIKFVYSHSMYIPIILAGIFFGTFFGTIIAFIAGIMLGPIMPINTISGEMQDPLNWIYRLLIFLCVGAIIGYASNKLRKDAKQIQRILSINQETNVPNTNFLKEICATQDYPSYSIVTILINNHNNMIDILGIRIYHELINIIYHDLLKGCPEGTGIVQAGGNKLWLIVPDDDLKKNILVIVDIMDQSRQIGSVPLYVDYSIGGSITYNIKDYYHSGIFEDADVSARNAQVNNLIYVMGDQNKYQKRTEYDLLASFTHALANQDIYLVFQPKIDLKTMKTYGLEALMRWEHPLRGNIPPAVFIPLIEETKLIHLLTDWVLSRTLEKCKDMLALGYRVPISLNISGKNLYDPNFFDRSIKIISDSGVPKDLIEFELTESTLMINPDECKAVLQKFVDVGIKISLDDFGSGYSSLAYLSQFPLEFIKIDRYFVMNFEDNSTLISIVKSTVELSKTLGYKVVIEGVESKEVVDMITAFGCDFAQGYYFAKPMASGDINTWYESNK